eukprot:m.40798 g.40798  ORF g.40798 m.40798 type:complete len:70 (-) comp9712_c0_seq1:64-273(-)
MLFLPMMTYFCQNASMLIILLTGSSTEAFFGFLKFSFSNIHFEFFVLQEDEQDDLSFICNRTALSNNNN